MLSQKSKDGSLYIQLHKRSGMCCVVESIQVLSLKGATHNTPESDSDIMSQLRLSVFLPSPQYWNSVANLLAGLYKQLRALFQH